MKHTNFEITKKRRKFIFTYEKEFQWYKYEVWVNKKMNHTAYICEQDVETFKTYINAL